MGRGDKRLRRRRRVAITLPIVFIGALLLILPLSATGQLGVLNDLLSLGHAGGQTPAPSATQHNAEPPLTATPRANCLPGSRKEPGIQGRVPNGAGSQGLHCNVSLVSHQGTSGGFKVHRYTDPKGHECGFYDTALLYPTNALKLSGTSQGVAALDMSNPARPRQTATLREIPMNSPHESLALNSRRGLLAAVMGNPSTAPGLVSIYDVRSDCRHPEAPVDPAGRAPRPRERLLRRRQNLLRHRHRGERDLGDRRDQPEEPPLDLAGEHHLARDVAEPRRQPRLPRRHRAASWPSSTPARSRPAGPTPRPGRSAG